MQGPPPVPHSCCSRQHPGTALSPSFHQEESPLAPARTRHGHHGPNPLSWGGSCGATLDPLKFLQTAPGLVEITHPGFIVFSIPCS